MQREFILRMLLAQQKLLKVSTEIEDYPVHRAVLDRSLPEILEIAISDQAALANLQLFCSSVDCFGNTPLKLAVKTGDYTAIKLLLKFGYCGPKLRPCLIAGRPYDLEFCMSAFELAVKIGDPESIKLFLLQNMKDQKRKWKKVQPRLNDCLLKIPDFTFKCKWDCENSWIPFFHSFMPNRSYQLFKRGNCFRLTAESKQKDRLAQTFVYDGD